VAEAATILPVTPVTHPRNLVVIGGLHVVQKEGDVWLGIMLRTCNFICQGEYVTPPPISIYSPFSVPHSLNSIA
jgi:hypothetical protein